MMKETQDTILKAPLTKKKKTQLVSQEPTNPDIGSDQSGESKYFIVALPVLSKFKQNG